MKYEYKFEVVNLNKQGVRVEEEKLNALGDQGWEIVNIWSEPRQQLNDVVQRVLLKKPLPGTGDFSPTYQINVRRGWFGKWSVRKGKL